MFTWPICGSGCFVSLFCRTQPHRCEYRILWCHYSEMYTKSDFPMQLQVYKRHANKNQARIWIKCEVFTILHWTRWYVQRPWFEIYVWMKPQLIAFNWIIILLLIIRCLFEPCVDTSAFNWIFVCRRPSATMTFQWAKNKTLYRRVYPSGIRYQRLVLMEYTHRYRRYVNNFIN